VRSRRELGRRDVCRSSHGQVSGASRARTFASDLHGAALLIRWACLRGWRMRGGDDTRFRRFASRHGRPDPHRVRSPAGGDRGRRACGAPPPPSPPSHGQKCPPGLSGARRAAEVRAGGAGDAPGPGEVATPADGASVPAADAVPAVGRRVRSGCQRSKSSMRSESATSTSTTACRWSSNGQGAASSLRQRPDAGVPRMCEWDACALWRISRAATETAVGCVSRDEHPVPT
jgi:hypothetical protein